MHLVRYDLVLSQIFAAQNEIDAAIDAMVRALNEGAQELSHEGELWQQVREAAQSLQDRTESEHLSRVLDPWMP